MERERPTRGVQVVSWKQLELILSDLVRKKHGSPIIVAHDILHWWNLQFSDLNGSENRIQ